MNGIIKVYRLDGDRAVTLRTVELNDKSKDELLDVLAAVRSGLPSDCGASLTDARGYNIR